MNFTEFLQKCPLSFILKFSTLILTEKLQSHFFTVTETLNRRHRINRQKSYSMYSLTMWYWILLNSKTSYNSWILHRILNVHVLNSQSVPVASGLFTVRVPVVVPPVLWGCCLGARKGIRPVKTEWWDAGVVICLQRGDAAATHCLLLQKNPDWFYLSGTGSTG